MFATYEIEASTVQMTYQTHPTFPEWVALMDQIMADPRFAPGMCILLDKRKVGPIPDTAYAESVARYYRERREKFGRCAIVVTGLHAFGMSRMAEGQCLDDRVRTFHDLDEAWRWIDGSTDQ